MKKLIILVLSAITVLLLLTACEPEHTHSFGEWNVTVEANCIKDGLRERVCECGEKETEVITATDKHDYVNGRCDVCDSMDPSLLVFELNDLGTGYIVSNSDKVGGNLIIPAEYRGLPVTGIGKGAFSHCDSLTSVVIPDSVTSIGSSAFFKSPIQSATIPAIACRFVGNEKLETAVITSGDNIVNYAFSGCENLRSVIIPEGITKIGRNAFSNCKTLSEIVLPSSVTSIEEDAFYGCKSLANIVISDGVKTIEQRAFASCGFTDIILPDSVTSIGEQAFIGCSSLESIVIPDKVARISEYTFAYCKNLKSVVISDRVESIDFAAFIECHSLATVSFGENSRLTIIDDLAFGLCFALESITLPNGLTDIGQGAFQACTGLVSVKLGDSVVNIGPASFAACDSLTNIAIPNSVINIGGDAFQGCTNLAYNIYENGLYLGNEENPYFALVSTSSKDVSSFTIHEDTRLIASKAFYDCKSLASITIPKGVGIINGNAFTGCSSLSNVVIPDNVTSLGYGVFYACTGLVSVNIGNGVESIGGRAFSECTSLKKVIIGNGLTEIQASAFENCESIDGVFINDIAAWCNIAFEDDSSNPLFYAKDLYIGEGESYELLTELVIPDGVTKINDYAFQGCTRIKSVVIPASLLRIGEYAFSNCTELTGVYISDIAAWFNISFALDESNPLWYAHNLYLNNGEEYELLTEIVVPEQINTIKYGAFMGCTSLRRIVIPEHVNYIGNFAFYECDNLTIYLEISEKVNGLESCWNVSDCPVVWGYIGE